MNHLFKTWKQDLPAGLVVYLVAIPLCLGISLASDAPAFAGLLGGIIGGIFIGILSGSSVGVSGPAAGLASIVSASITELSAFEIFLNAVIIAGIIQLILGVLRLGFIAYYIPNNVIQGMLCAIGIIIILKQIPHAVGFDNDYLGDTSFFQRDGKNTFSELWEAFNHISISAIILCVFCLLILILWEQNFIKKTVLKQIPGPLLVVIAGILFTLFTNNTWLAIAKEHRVDLGISGKSFKQLFVNPDFSHFFDKKVWVIGLTIAIVASIETLLSLEAADKLDPKKRISSGSRELLAQGAGNVVSGFLGGLPLTQVVVRTSANVNAGGISKLAAIFHGLLIAITVLIFPQIFSNIPYSALAAILFMVGFKLAKPSIFFKIFKSGWFQFIPFLATVVCIVYTDILIGVGVGFGLSILSILHQNFKLAASHTNETEGTHLIKFTEQMTFLNKASLLEKFRLIPANSKVIIDQSTCRHISPDINDSLEDFKIQALSRNITVEIIH